MRKGRREGGGEGAKRVYEPVHTNFENLVSSTQDRNQDIQI